MKKILSFVAVMLLSIAGMSAQTVTVSVTDKITDGEKYYRTFVSDQVLDFTDVEGLKAYTAVANVGGDFFDGYYAEAKLTPVSVLPAGEAVVIIADEAKDYVVPVGDEDDEDVININDLVGVTEKTDMADIIDYDYKYFEYKVFPAVLQAVELQDEDDEVAGVEIGFADYLPSRENGTFVTGEKFLEAGEAYLPLDEDGYETLAYGSWYGISSVKLVIAGQEPEQTTIEVDNIAGLASVSTTSKVNLKAKDVVVTYAYMSSDYERGTVIMEDETGGVVLEDVPGIAGLFDAGTVFNGVLPLTVKVRTVFGYTIKTVTADEYEFALAAFGDDLDVEYGEGEVEPTEITSENVFDYAVAYNWKYVKFTNATFTETEDEEIYLEVPVMGTYYPIFDAQGILDYDEYPTDGSVVTATGYLYDYDFGDEPMIMFQPISFTSTTVGINGVQEKSQKAELYNLNGMRVATPQKGLYIRDGKKVVVK